MFQLNFYPHLDIHHTAFRAVCVGVAAPALPIDAYRLIDFFLIFPFELGIIRQRGSKLKKIAASFDTARPYRWVSEPTQTFLQMIEFQTVAIRALARKMVLEGAAIETDRFEISKDFQIDGEMAREIEKFLSERLVVIEALVEIIGAHGMTGKDGLKARSGLMPFKYDVDENVVIN